MMTSRAEAGLPPSNAAVRPLDRIVGVTFHYSTGQELGAPEARRWWRNIWRYHVEDRGYDDVAYHVGIDMRTGEELEGRPIDRVGAHSSGHNTGWLGICFLGNDDAGVLDVSEAAWQTAVRRVREWESELGRTLRVESHRTQKERGGSSTGCPGDEVIGRLKTVFSEDLDMVKPDLVIYARRGVDFDSASSIVNARGGAGAVAVQDRVLAQRWLDAGARTVALGAGSAKDLVGEVEVVGATALETLIDGAGLAG